MGTILDDFYKDGTLISSGAYKDNLARVNYSKERLDKYFEDIQSIRYHESYVVTDPTVTTITLVKGTFTPGRINVTLNDKPFTNFKESSNNGIILNSPASKGDEFNLYYYNTDGISQSEINKLVVDYQSFLIEAKNLRELIESIKEVWSGYYQDAADKAISDLKNFYEDQDNKRTIDYNQYKSDRLAELDKIFSIVPDLQTATNDINAKVAEAKETFSQLDAAALIETVKEMNSRMADLLESDEKSTAATQEATKAATDANQFVHDVFTHQEKYKGLQGDTTYVHWAWAWNETGSDRFSTVYPNENLIVQANTSANLLSATDGTETASTTDDDKETAFIPVKTGEKYTYQIWLTLAGDLNISAIWYDSSKKFLSGESMTDKDAPATGSYHGTWNLTVPDKAAFIKISWRGYTDSKVKLEVGTIATEWVPSTTDDPDNSHPYYMGYANTLTADPVEDFTKYSWFRIKGDQGNVPNMENYLTKDNVINTIRTNIKVNDASPDPTGNIKVKTLVSVSNSYLVTDRSIPDTI